MARYIGCILYVFASLLSYIEAFAQFNANKDGKEEEKYWYYRYRLRQEFMEPGITNHILNVEPHERRGDYPSGHSIPASDVNKAHKKGLMQGLFPGVG